MIPSLELIKSFREQTGAGVMESKKLLTEAQGDLEKALLLFRKLGKKVAASKESRTSREGIVGAYIHSNERIGVLVEVNCETDFVARSPAFKELVHDIALHIAAASPAYLQPEEVPLDVLEEEKPISKEHVRNERRSAHDPRATSEDSLQNFYEEKCLLKQKFVKDQTKTIEEILQEKTTQLGERIRVKRFARFQVGF